MKRAFTFAELMISLVVISILAAILYPTVAHFTPNANKPLFKSAYKSLTLAISTIVNDKVDGELPLCTVNDAVSGLIPIENNNSCVNFNTSATALCMAMCEKMNVLPKAGAANNGTACTGNQNICNNGTANVFRTTNGMRWQFFNYNVAGRWEPYDGVTRLNNVFHIAVDVNAKNNNQIPSDNAAVAVGGINYCFDSPAATYDGVFYYHSNPARRGNNESIYNADGTMNVDHLRNQDTFYFAIDIRGNIVSMSPAGYANLEDANFN